jgi:hypothetical protein
MDGTGRLRRMTVVVGLVVLVLAGLTGAAHNPAAADSVPVTVPAAVAATAAVSPVTPAPLDTRLQRNPETASGQRAAPQDGINGPSSHHRRPRAWVEAHAAVLERAAHPERVSPILLRAPPVSTT